jgi:hypothetical protein
MDESRGMRAEVDGASRILLQGLSKAKGHSTGVRCPAGVGTSSLRHRVQTDSGAYPASCSMCTGDKADGA